MPKFLNEPVWVDKNGEEKKGASKIKKTAERVKVLTSWAPDGGDDSIFNVGGKYDKLRFTFVDFKQYDEMMFNYFKGVYFGKSPLTSSVGAIGGILRDPVSGASLLGVNAITSSNEPFLEGQVTQRVFDWGVKELEDGYSYEGIVRNSLNPITMETDCTYIWAEDMNGANNSVPMLCNSFCSRVEAIVVEEIEVDVDACVDVFSGQEIEGNKNFKNAATFEDGVTVYSTRYDATPFKVETGSIITQIGGDGNGQNSFFTTNSFRKTFLFDGDIRVTSGHTFRGTDIDKQEVAYGVNTIEYFSDALDMFEDAYDKSTGRINIDDVPWVSYIYIAFGEATFSTVLGVDTPPPTFYKGLILLGNDAGVNNIRVLKLFDLSQGTTTRDYIEFNSGKQIGVNANRDTCLAWGLRMRK